MESVPASRSPRPHKKMFSRLFVGAVFITLAAAGGFFYIKYQEVLNAPTPTQKLVDTLSPVIELPQESPDLLTIADASKLSNQALASYTRNGDQLLVFNQAKKIIVYRPSVQKVITILTIQAPVSTEATLAP